MPKAIQRYQLKQQTCLNPQLPRCHSQSSRPQTSLAATAKPAVQAEAVRAEFSAAGISDEVVANTLKKYPPYLGWPIHTKLRPALQLWLKDLSSQQLSERLDKYPKLLVRTPQECTDVYLWLASLGVDAERIQQKLPVVIGRKLNEVQSTFQTIQTALELTNEQLPAFFKQHYFGLQYSSVRVSQTLQTIAELLAVPLAAEEMHEVMKATGHELFDQVPAVLHDRVSFFCKDFEGGQHAAKAALKQGVYRVSADLLRERAAELRTMLGWTEEECNRALSSNPRILTYQPSTVATNIQKLQAHNFTSVQALDIYASYPSLAGYDWNSPLNVDKLEYLTLILQLSRARIASRPQLLGASLAHKTGPRTEFIYRSRASTPDMPLGLLGCSSYVDSWSDARFAAKFNILSACPPLVYDETFKQHWWQRWTFLRHEMGLSAAEICGCRALLFTSLPNTLAPRWCFLMRLEAAQADFKAADHLTALATLSDQLFAETFDMLEEGLKVV